MITDLGSRSIGGCLPTMVALSAQMSAMANVVLPDISARLSASLTVQPPALASDLVENLLKMVAALQALMATGSIVIPPAINASLSADLQAMAGTLNLAIAFAAQVDSLLGGNGVNLWLFEGRDTSMGSEISGQVGAGLAGGPDTTAIILATTLPGTALALKTVFGIS
jgi:hypothetical protein